jgi:hypothetical protein
MRVAGIFLPDVQDRRAAQASRAQEAGEVAADERDPRWCGRWSSVDVGHRRSRGGGRAVNALLCEDLTLPAREAELRGVRKGFAAVDAEHVTLGVGVQWELPAAVARRHQRHVFGFFQIPARRWAFCRDGGLGSSNRPFPRRRPQSNGSARKSSGSNPAGRREAAIKPHGLHAPERRSGSPGPRWMAQSAVVRDYRALETGRRRANRLV